MYSIPAIAPSNLRRPPDAFLERPVGQKWLDALAREYPHERYTRQRSDDFSAKQRNLFASKIIEAKRDDLDIDQLLQDEIRPAEFYWTWCECVEPELESYFENHNAARRVDHWAEEIRPLWEDRAADADTSRVTDLFSSWDTCEILFQLTPTRCAEDNLIQSHRSWSEPSELAITSELQYALNQIGYTVSEFRKLARNKHEAYSPLAATRRRRDPIVDWPKLSSTIENACSSMFGFYLFAIAPLTDLIKLDLTKPITFSPCWLATMNPFSGTFHDEPCATPVTVSPTDGVLISGADVSYSPDEVCGLHRPHYHGRITNPE